jgi:mannose-6-phosphate isomerase-like protein (cupin superfamily)
MSSNWRPDDSLNERDKKGVLNGEKKIKAALAKNKVRIAKGVTTSRDRGMAAVKRDLKKTGMPRGVKSFQIPFVLGGCLWFLSCYEPGTIVPMHAHKLVIFRIVISGEMKHGRRILKQGDWMYVPAGQPYSIQAVGKETLWVFYGHG